jgi:hypothetical protein
MREIIQFVTSEIKPLLMQYSMDYRELERITATLNDILRAKIEAERDREARHARRPNCF